MSNPTKKRDVFIVMTEDICNNFGCYGDVNAKTPCIDEFAKENIRFNYCSSAAPVCSAARTSLNLGMFGSTGGVGQHRSSVMLPERVKTIGTFMQNAGYFTAIGKTDFNFLIHDGNLGYDMHVVTTNDDSYEFAQTFEDVIKAADKPVFMVQTTGCTHQSQYGNTENTEEHRKTMPRLQESDKVDRDAIVLPDYHMESPEAREIWGQYYEKIATLDRMFGETIDILKKNGKYEDSVIIFVGDNGHGVPAGKCELWNEGVHVPFILHVPKDLEADLVSGEDKFGRYSDRLTSFIDFPPTVLSLAGADIPEQMQGEIFLGDKTQENRTAAYAYSERVDEVFEDSRCVRDNDYLLTCDFAYSKRKRPNSAQTLLSPWFVRSMIDKGYENNISDEDRRAFFRSMPRIKEQLFDMKSDPAQLCNIANRKDMQDKLSEMRNKLLDYSSKYRDGQFMPEPMYYELMDKSGLCVYDILRDDSYYPVDELIAIWKDMLAGNCNLQDHSNACARMLIIRNFAEKGEFDKIKKFLSDESETVKAYAAFQLEDEEVMIKICETSKNGMLLQYIIDLLLYWDKSKVAKIIDIIHTRNTINKEFPDPEDRNLKAIPGALNMLRAKHGLELTPENPKGMPKKPWSGTINQRLLHVTAGLKEGY